MILCNKLLVNSLCTHKLIECAHNYIFRSNDEFTRRLSLFENGERTQKERDGHGVGMLEEVGEDGSVVARERREDERALVLPEGDFRGLGISP